MPYKVKKLPNRKYDGRIKLTEDDRLKIHELYEEGMSIRGITKLFNVSRRLIQFTLFPERLEACKLARAKRGGSKQYYNKEKNTIAVRKTRRKIQKIVKELKNEN